MRRALWRRVALWTWIGLNAGCIPKFDQNGQPCDSFHNCVPGYVCNRNENPPVGACHPGGTNTAASGSNGTTTNGNTTNGTNGTNGTHSTGQTGSTTGSIGTTGTSATTSTTGVTTSSSTGSTGTTSNLCDAYPCPVAQICQMNGGVPSCVARTNTGSSITCVNDSNCTTSGYSCLKALGAPSTSEGLCTKSCASSSCAAGDVCTSLPNARGDIALLCLPASPPSTCSDDYDCQPFGLHCRYFTHSSDGSMPLPLCDTASGGSAGASCSSDADCISAVCVKSVCLDICSDPSVNNCAAGSQCVVTPLGLSLVHGYTCATGSAQRCLSCAGVACTSFDSDTCDPNLECNLKCSTTEVDPCGPDTVCSAGYCESNNGSCPP